MNELDLPTIPERVEKGIGWLEEVGGWRWADKIVEAVEVGQFAMNHECTCAVGVVLGNYFGNFFDLLPEDGDSEDTAARFGFDFGHGENGEETYALLEAEWERKARERVAWLAEVDG